MGWIAMFIILVGTLPPVAHAQEGDAFERMRAEMIDRQRRVILNNDGNDATIGAKGATPEAMLAARTVGLEETHVDSIFYCTNRGTFSRHTHRSNVTETFMQTDGRFRRNVVPALVEQGTDPLQVMIEWCRAHDREIFWSERMNDRHDASVPEMVSRWKREHPECLVGTPENPPPHGAWSQVDYAEKAVRDQMYAIIEEVCRNYDVDGIEMDFFRHPTFFRSTAWGAQASDEEIAIMTGFVRRVRAMTERVGRERGRPILVAIRVVDSVPLAKAMGLDLEAWLNEGLVDLMTGSGYFRMNPWSYLAELGHHYGVKTYACLSDSRVNEDGAPFSRRSQQSYRARAARAWHGGVDGIYLFNMFNPRMGFLKEIGDPEVLAGLDRTYFVTVRGATNRSYGNPDYWLADGSQWRNVPVLTPEKPISLAPGESCTVPLRVGEGVGARAICYAIARTGEGLSVRLNGEPLTQDGTEGPWLAFPLPQGALRVGENTFEFSAAERAAGAGSLASTIEWRADVMPRAPWRHGKFRSHVAFAEMQDGALLIADRGTNVGDYIYFSYAWEARPDTPAEVEAEVKVIGGWNNITVSNGVATERVTLYPDHIGTYYSGLRYDMDTTDDFHTYRVVVQDDDIRVYADGELRIDGEGEFTHDAGGRNDAAIGAANSPSTGEALWRAVRLTSPGIAGAQIYDLVVLVEAQEAD